MLEHPGMNDCFDGELNHNGGEKDLPYDDRPVVLLLAARGGPAVPFTIQDVP
ncbi:uncharacterized protein J3R85_006136 [Psidium guajava]|nr:uncharacterized protein J3R85_006136 [Psidium guajava]